jgi:concanavalin A-like lectin/glucanase superfamily protein
MGASFASASSQCLVNSTPPITGTPFSLGMWVYPTVNLTGRTLWSLCDLVTGNNRYRVRTQSAGAISAMVIAGGTETGAATGAGVVVVDKWVFFVARFITSTNRHISALSADGSVANASNTQLRAVTAATAMYLGVNEAVSEFYNGGIGEFWYTNTDIQPDAATLASSTLLQLAYGGPFSVPYIAKDIVEYRSFRSSPDSRGDRMGEVFHGAKGRQTWDNTNGVTVGPHPPLPYWFIRPAQNRRVLVV